MRYEEIPPPKAAAEHVESIWMFNVDALAEHARDHVIVPDGAVSIAIIKLPTNQIVASFSGPSKIAHKTSLIPDAVYCGVRLHPGVAGSVLGYDIESYVGAFGPSIEPRPGLLDTIQSNLPSAAALDELPDILRFAAATISDCAAPIDKPIRGLASAIMASGGGEPLHELTVGIALSDRQLRRRFKYQCGLTPKAFARLRRLRQACIELLSNEPADRAAASIETGFADQAHMSREFKDVFGGSVSLVEAYLRQIRQGGIV